MEKNFHYHVTYTAAVLAGFSTDDALVIARAAQYVDDCDGETVQANGTIFLSNILDVLPGWNDEIQAILNIWPVFHFLPGNFTAISADVNPQLPVSPKPRLRLAPPLICGTESGMTRAIVEGAWQYYQNQSEDYTKRLQRIGITMHVLADTFAHQGFAGIPLSLVNEVAHVRQAASDSDLRVKPYIYSPAGFTSSSFGYLGHGRLGHLPDQPGGTFVYEAAWRNPAGDHFISRYNPLEFYCAYRQMKESMEFILGKSGGFDNAANRGLLLDHTKDEWPKVRPFLEAFERAGSDQNLPGPWYAAVKTVRQPRDYTPYDPREELPLRESFLAAAHGHRTLVAGNCKALRDYQELFS